MSLTCDITGNNPLFKLTGLRYRVNVPASTTGAYKLLLPQAGYKESVVVKKINSDGTLYTLINGANLSAQDNPNLADFFFTDSNREPMAEDLVRGSYPTFTGELYKSFLIPHKTFGTAQYLDLIIEFQSAFPNILTSSVDQSGNPNGPTCSPDLLRQIVEDLILLKGASAGEDVNYSTAQALPSPLATDYTGELVDNHIEDEAHTILANEGKVVVRPANGSFYDYDPGASDQVKAEYLVVRDSNGNILQRERDYTVRGMDIAATKVCEHPGGVWRYIIITKNIVGTIFISYHAFGGEVNVQNFLNIRDQIQALKDYIDKGAFLTANTVGNTPLMQEVIERLNTLDRYYMSLNMSGYRDMSNRFVALPNNNNDGNSNWYRVAYLYKPTKTNSDNTYLRTFTKDSVRLKLRLENSGIILDLFIYANVKNGTLNISMQEADSDTGSALPDNYNNLKSVILPQFRLVWRKDNDYQSGAVLQIKFPIPEGFDNEIVSVENHNKAGLGGWILRGDANGTDEVMPENTEVVLPCGDKIWQASGNSTTFGVATTYPNFKNGTILWAGSVNLSFEPNPFISPVPTRTLYPIVTSPINCKAIKNLTFLFFDRVLYCYTKKTFVVNSIDGTCCTVSGIIDDLDQCTLTFSISHTDNKPVFTIYPNLGTKSFMMHRFDLRQIYINLAGE